MTISTLFRPMINEEAAMRLEQHMARRYSLGFSGKCLDAIPQTEPSHVKISRTGLVTGPESDSRLTNCEQ